MDLPRKPFREFAFQKNAEDSAREDPRSDIKDRSAVFCFFFFLRDERWSVKESQRKMIFECLLKRFRSLLNFYSDSDFSEYN